eukprot:Rmarinus@m.10677
MSIRHIFIVLLVIGHLGLFLEAQDPTGDGDGGGSGDPSSLEESDIPTQPIPTTARHPRPQHPGGGGGGGHHPVPATTSTAIPATLTDVSTSAFSDVPSTTVQPSLEWIPDEESKENVDISTSVEESESAVLGFGPAELVMVGCALGVLTVLAAGGLYALKRLESHAAAAETEEVELKAAGAKKKKKKGNKTYAQLEVDDYA